jgi:hypothetical protein
MYDALPSIMTVYRGLDACRGYPRGLSWTTDLAVAQKFAEGRRVTNPNPVVITARVRKSSVAMCHVMRNECETVLFAPANGLPEWAEARGGVRGHNDGRFFRLTCRRGVRGGVVHEAVSMLMWKREHREVIISRHTTCESGQSESGRSEASRIPRHPPTLAPSRNSPHLMRNLPFTLYQNTFVQDASSSLAPSRRTVPALRFGSMAI